MSNKTADLVSNRKATHDYEILETFEAGIALKGTEIKSIRDHGATLQESYITIKKQEAWLVGCNIAAYKFGNVHNHEERRERKLLLHKRELVQLQTAIQEKGLTIIPLAMYLKDGRIKLRIAIAKGKKAIDKRASLKEKDEKKRVQQALKQHR